MALIGYVEVTGEDIRFNGSGPSLCPIALAIARLLGVGCNHVHVYADEVILYCFGRRPVVLRTPAVASRFVKEWDEGGDPNPVSFAL